MNMDLLIHHISVEEGNKFHNHILIVNHKDPGRHESHSYIHPFLPEYEYLSGRLQGQVVPVNTGNYRYLQEISLTLSISKNRQENSFILPPLSGTPVIPAES